MQIPNARNNSIHPEAFAKDHPDPSTKYGLPKDIVFCKRCVISNQRPNSSVEFRHTKNSIKDTIAFDDKGICDACNFASKKNNDIDWEQREAELKQLCNKFKSRNGSYDCLVPGSGGKDSFYASWILKYKYGMNPLTVTWAPNIYTEWGRKNFDAWINSGMDNYLFTPSGRSKRLLTRLALENLFHPFQPFMLGQKCFAPKMAIQTGIPLIFYGENEAEYGNPQDDNSSATRSYDYFATTDDKDLFISGVSLVELQNSFGLTRAELSPYLPSDVSALESMKAEVHYLGYYLKWHPQAAYYFAVENGGFEPSSERNAGTYSKYNSIDDKIDDFHYYTTFIKFGIGRASYDAAQEIRSGDIDREEAVQLVNRYDGEFPDRWATEIFDYLSISESEYPKAFSSFEHPQMNFEYFSALTDSFRSPHIWYLDEYNAWKLRKQVSSFL